MAHGTRQPPNVDGYALVDRAEPGQDFLYVEEFLPPEDCALLIRAFTENAGRILEKAPGNPLFDGRILYFQQIPDSHIEARRIMVDAQRRTVAALMAFYGLERRLFVDTLQLNAWREGEFMRPHADNAHADGTPNPSPWRDYGAIVYLNDDYDGGDLFLAAQRIRLRTRTGLLIAFPAGVSHVHGVTAVERGTRYTMPSWYTHAARHRDRDVAAWEKAHATADDAAAVSPAFRDLAG